MTIADQIYEKVKGLPEDEQAEILSLVDLRSRQRVLGNRVSTKGLIHSKEPSPTWEDFRDARREAWRGLGDPPVE